MDSHVDDDWVLRLPSPPCSLSSVPRAVLRTALYLPSLRSREVRDTGRDTSWLCLLGLGMWAGFTLVITHGLLTDGYSGECDTYTLTRPSQISHIITVPRSLFRSAPPPPPTERLKRETEESSRWADEMDGQKTVPTTAHHITYYLDLHMGNSEVGAMSTAPYCERPKPSDKSQRKLAACLPPYAYG